MSVDDHVQEVLESFQRLEPIAPSEAIKQFLSHKSREVRPQTVSEYRRKLDHLQQFCTREGIDNLNELNGRTIYQYREYRRTETADTTLSNNTMRDDLYLLREFVEFLEHTEAVRLGLSDKIDIPKLREKDGVRDISIAHERVERILSHLNKYEYATRPHVVWFYHAHTGRRPGSLYGLDIGDVHIECERPYIELRHRPEETELKNGEGGETEIYISDQAAQIFGDYIDNQRVEVTTENGREPFLTSRHGRLSKTSMRKYIYRFSRPCIVTGECPHERDIDSCEGTESNSSASKCPSSRPPYALRHGYITSKLQEGAPTEIVGDRCDVSKKIIEKHYDERTEQEKRERRKEVLEQLRGEQPQTGGGYR